LGKTLMLGKIEGKRRGNEHLKEYIETRGTFEKLK